MKEEMVEFIAYYSTHEDDIMLSPRKNMFVEFFIVRIYEDKIDYTKTTVRTEDSGMMMNYSREYGEKLQWNTVKGTDFSNAEEVIELVMNIFKNNADYVYPTTSSKLKDNILKAIIVVMVLAIVIFAIINMIVNWDIGELITVVIVVIIGMLIDLRKKNRFLSR